MANRLEAVCWDRSNDDIVSLLKGNPCVYVDLLGNGQKTNSILELHRVNSPYVSESEDSKVFDLAKSRLAAVGKGQVDFQ